MCRALRGGEICDEIPISKCLWPSYLLNQSQQASMVPLAFLHHFQVQPMREHLKAESGQRVHISKEKRKKRRKTKQKHMKWLWWTQLNQSLQASLFTFISIIFKMSVHHTWMFLFCIGLNLRGKKKQNMMFNKLFVPENLFFGNLIGVYLFTAAAPP